MGQRGLTGLGALVLSTSLGALVRHLAEGCGAEVWGFGSGHDKARAAARKSSCKAETLDSKSLTVHKTWLVPDCLTALSDCLVWLLWCTVKTS